VRVAVALVAGQAALCAVIGWLTFGPAPAPSRPSAALDPPAPPRLAMPSISIAPPPTSAPPTSPPPTTRATSSPRAAVARFARPPRPPAPPKQPDREGTSEVPPLPLDSPISPTPTESASPSPDPNASPLPSSTDVVQHPVVEGGPCEPEGALGRTVDDVALRCLRGEDGRLVWQINSQQ
jgi:hypothetical protein